MHTNFFNLQGFKIFWTKPVDILVFIIISKSSYIVD